MWRTMTLGFQSEMQHWNAVWWSSLWEHMGDFTSWQSRLRNLIFFKFFLLRSFDLKMHTNADRNRTWGDETGHESFQSDISYSQTQSSHSHWCYERVQREKGTGSCYCSQQTFQERFTGRVITSLNIILRIRKCSANMISRRLWAW